MDSSLLDPAAALRRVGFRVAASRLAVHTALAASAPHSSVDAVVSAIAGVDCAVGDTPRLVAADDSGYEIDEAGSSTMADASSVSRRLLSRPAS